MLHDAFEDRHSASRYQRGALAPCPTATDSGNASARRGLLLRLDPAMHKRLRLLAVEEDTTVQALGVEALEMLFQYRRGSV